MSYQFKYMDVPTDKACNNGGFSPLKFALQSVLVLAAIGMICHFKMGNNSANMPMPSPDQIASAAQSYNAGTPSAQVYGSLGLNPSQAAMNEAQHMAQNFMATGDLSMFEKYSKEQLSLDF